MNLDRPFLIITEAPVTQRHTLAISGRLLKDGDVSAAAALTLHRKEFDICARISVFVALTFLPIYPVFLTSKSSKLNWFQLAEVNKGIASTWLARNSLSQNGYGRPAFIE